MTIQKMLCVDLTDKGLFCGYFQADVVLHDSPRSAVVTSVDKNCGRSVTYRHAFNDVFVDEDGRRIAIFAQVTGRPIIRDEREPPPGYEIHHYTPREHGVASEHWRIRVKDFALMTTFDSKQDALRTAWQMYDEHSANPGRSEEDITQPFEHAIFVLHKKIEAVCTIVESFGHASTAERKQWIIDKMLRALMSAREYDEWKREYNEMVDEDSKWSEGVAP